MSFEAGRFTYREISLRCSRLRRTLGRHPDFILHFSGRREPTRPVLADEMEVLKMAPTGTMPPSLWAAMAAKPMHAMHPHDLQSGFSPSQRFSRKMELALALEIRVTAAWGLLPATKLDAENNRLHG
jgi:hypothetical protein